MHPLAALAARAPVQPSAVSIGLQVRELVERHVDIEGPDEPLQLSSLEVVMLAEALEERFGLRIHAADVKPENFGTLSRLVAFVERSSSA